MYFLLYVENYYSGAFLNTRNRKICFLRIGAVYHFFTRVPKLEVPELLEDGKLHLAVPLRCTVCAYTVNVHITQRFSAHPQSACLWATSLLLGALEHRVLGL